MLLNVLVIEDDTVIRGLPKAAARCIWASPSCSSRLRFPLLLPQSACLAWDAN